MLEGKILTEMEKGIVDIALHIVFKMFPLLTFES